MPHERISHAPSFWEWDITHAGPRASPTARVPKGTVGAALAGPTALLPVEFFTPHGFKDGGGAI